MLYVGLDLSRKRLDWNALDADGESVAAGALPPDRGGLGLLVERVGVAQPVMAVIESMTGARFVHDELERAGWDVRVADAQKARGIAPLACKTDRIDCWVLAELARLGLVPEIWLPDPAVRQERERVRFRLHPDTVPSRDEPDPTTHEGDQSKRTLDTRPSFIERTQLPRLRFPSARDEIRWSFAAARVHRNF